MLRFVFVVDVDADQVDNNDDDDDEEEEEDAEESA